MAVIGVLGLGVNLFIALAGGSEALGIFGQTYLVFALQAQIATFGLHHATLQYTAVAVPQARSGILVSGIVSSTPAALLVSCLGLGVAGPIATLFGSDPLKQEIFVASFAILFHVWNKILMGFLNACEKMILFAVMQALRAVFFFIAIVLISTAETSEPGFGFAFLISELLTFLVLAVTINIGQRLPMRPSARVSFELLKFGAKGFTGGLLQELNFRVDIVVLAILVSDSKVGAYTLAATAIEGAFQLLVVLRNNFNPKIAKALASKDKIALQELLKLAKKISLPTFGAIFLIGLVASRPLMNLISLETSLYEALNPIFILLAGVLVASPLAPFDQVMLMARKPELQTLTLTSLVFLNFLFNFTLIPSLGLEGAAISTAALLCIQAGVNRVFLWRSMKPNSSQTAFGSKSPSPDL